MKHMLLKIFSISIVFLMCTSLESAQYNYISITSPHNNDRVSRPAEIKGTVSDADADVFVVVHPESVPEYWVQPKARVDKKGKWRTLIYLGRQHSNNHDKQYEIRAIADPHQSLKEGDMLKKWPNSNGTSPAVIVKRKSTGKLNYYIQVGMWSNKHNAMEIVKKLKAHYPDVNMVPQGKFTKVIVLHIKSKAQGSKVMKDIEQKFKLKPILKLDKK